MSGHVVYRGKVHKFLIQTECKRPLQRFCM